MWSSVIDLIDLSPSRKEGRMNRFTFTIVGESELTDDEIADILQNEMSKLETLLNGEIGIGYYEPINEQGERREK